MTITKRKPGEPNNITQMTTNKFNNIEYYEIIKYNMKYVCDICDIFFLNTVRLMKI